MCALSNRIREKSNWWEKVKDETIVEKWREEALQQAEDCEQPEWKLTPGMVSLASCLPATPAFLINPMSQVKYALEELQGYAALRHPETGIEARFSSQAMETRLTQHPF